MVEVLIKTPSQYSTMTTTNTIKEAIITKNKNITITKMIITVKSKMIRDTVTEDLFHQGLKTVVIRHDELMMIIIIVIPDAQDLVPNHLMIITYQNAIIAPQCHNAMHEKITFAHLTEMWIGPTITIITITIIMIIGLPRHLLCIQLDIQVNKDIQQHHLLA